MKKSGESRGLASNGELSHKVGESEAEGGLTPSLGVDGAGQDDEPIESTESM